MRMRIFYEGERVKLSDELLQHSANKHWQGKRGTVLKDLGGSYVLVKWDHLDSPMEQIIDYIELAPNYPV